MDTNELKGLLIEALRHEAPVNEVTIGDLVLHMHPVKGQTAARYQMAAQEIRERVVASAQELIDRAARAAEAEGDVELPRMSNELPKLADLYRRFVDEHFIKLMRGDEELPVDLEDGETCSMVYELLFKASEVSGPLPLS